MVKQLMDSRKIKPALLDIIAVTRTGRRAERQKQDMESQEEERDKAWVLEADRLDGITRWRMRR